MPSQPLYPFDAYLVHLRGELDASQRGLATAQHRHHDEQQRMSHLVEVRNQLQLEQRRWQEDLEAGFRAARWTVAEIVPRQNHLKRLSGDLEVQRRAVLAQQRTVHAAERAVAEARSRLEEIAAETKAHEERKETWLEDLRRGQQRVEQKQMDEIGQAIHERRRREDR